MKKRPHAVDARAVPFCVARALLIIAITLISASPAAFAQGTATSAANAAADVPPQPPPPPPAAAQCQPGVRFDTAAATAAYLASVPADRRARSDAYVTGGYWIDLWSTLLTIGVMLLLLASGWARRIGTAADRFAIGRTARTFIALVLFILVTSVLTFPFTIYTDFVREHQYGLATQQFGPWLVDQLKGLGIGVLAGGLGLTLVYAVVRRFPRSWTLWGSATAIVLFVISVLISPVYIVPLFNTIRPLTDARVRDPILRMASANGIAAREVYVIDASRQSTRVSANVSGVFGTERITLNDNLLRRASLPEIEAVMGHEMGHYVLHHIYQAIIFFAVVIVVGFAVLARGFAWAVARRGPAWGIRDIGDVSGYPLAVALFTAYAFVMTPVVNTYVRSNEAAADSFGLNASRQPDGFAQVALKLGDYRKLDPGPFEKFVFFDHPSGHDRIAAAMRWKAAELCDSTSQSASHRPRGDRAVAE